MALSPQTLRAWANGTKADNMVAGEDAPDVDPEGGDIGAQNEFWTGTVPVDQMDPQEAADFLAWLEEHEPDIFEATTALASAVLSQDPTAMQQAEDMLEEAPQVLAPEYPPFTPEQRHELVENMVDELEGAGFPEEGDEDWTSAVASALVRARVGQEEAPLDEEPEAEPEPQPDTEPPQAGPAEV
jgi:hypothetical protein